MTELFFFFFCVACFSGCMLAVAVNGGWIERSDPGDL